MPHNLASPRPPGNPGGPISDRTDVAPASAILPFEPPPLPPMPIAWFARLHRALREGDSILARRAVRELDAVGYAVAVRDGRGGPP